MITGASSGLGKPLAAAARAANGMRVGMVARDAARPEAACEEIRQQTGNPRVRLYVADLAVQSAVRDFAAAVINDPKTGG